MVGKYTYLGIFLPSPNKTFSLNEFENHFRIPHQTLKSHLELLTKEKILLQEKRKRFLFYTLNHKNPLIIDYLSICEKERLINFLKKPLFRRLYDTISAFFDNSQFLIFGSAASDNHYNDLDLLILSKKQDMRTALQQFEATYSIKLHIILTDEKNITKTFLEEIRKSHIILNNHDYFTRLFYDH